MKVGMLWFDNDAARALDEKIRRAAIYYQKKYGREPSVCYIHPSMLPNGASAPNNGAIRVQPAPWILPNHYWLGLNGTDAEDTEEEEAAA